MRADAPLVGTCPIALWEDFRAFPIWLRSCDFVHPIRVHHDSDDDSDSILAQFLGDWGLGHYLDCHSGLPKEEALFAFYLPTICVANDRRPLYAVSGLVDGHVYFQAGGRNKCLSTFFLAQADHMGTIGRRLDKD